VAVTRKGDLTGLSPICMWGMLPTNFAASDQGPYLIVIGFDGHVFETPLGELPCLAYWEIVLGNRHALLQGNPIPLSGALIEMLVFKERGDSCFDLFNVVGSLLWIVTRRIGENNLQVIGPAIGVIDFVAAIDVKINC